MRRPIITLLVLVVSAALVMPAIATAAGGPPEGKGKPASTAKGGSPEFKDARKAEKSALKDARKAQKAAAKAEKAQRKAERLAAGVLEADESEGASPSVDASPSTEGTKSVGAGVANALSRITRNIERRIEKFGWDAGVPMGLMRVWMKFSTWLGNDTGAPPWTPPVSDDTSPIPPPSGDTSPTSPPSGEESPTTEPSAIVVPVAP